MPGPVCVQCDGCGRVLRGSFRTYHAAYHAALKAGWGMDPPKCDEGEISFYDDQECRCPDYPECARKARKRLMKEAQRLLDRNQTVERAPKVSKD